MGQTLNQDLEATIDPREAGSSTISQPSSALSRRQPARAKARSEKHGMSLKMYFEMKKPPQERNIVLVSA